MLAGILDVHHYTTFSHTAHISGWRDTHRALIISIISGSLWIFALSMTMTEFAAGYGCMHSSKSPMNCLNVSAVNAPGIILHHRMPDKPSAGSIEYLWGTRQQSGL